MNYRFKGINVPTLLLALGITTVLGFAMHGCGGGGGSSSGGSTGTIQLSGTISSSVGSGYSHKSSMVPSLNPTIDKVLAIPMDRGSLNSWGMQNSKTAAITADGSFSIGLEKTTDWLLVLINSAGSGTGRFVGSLAMDAGTSGSLLNLPATITTISSMALGTISRTGTRDALSTRVVTTSDFTNLSASQLTAMAQTDDVFRNAMNIVNNYGTFGGAGIWYRLRPDFSWTGVSSELTTTAGTSPALAFKGMSFQLDTNATTVGMNTLCLGGVTTVELVPPAPISTGSITYGPGAPITNAGCALSALNAGQQASGTNFYATNVYSGEMSYSVPADFTTIPAGSWLWKENGTVRASFDINTVSPPYVAGTGQPTGFVPSFKINFVGITKQIASVDINWFYYDGVGYTAVLPADLAVLEHFISSFEVKFDVQNGPSRKTCEMYVDPVTTTHVRPADFPTVGECSHAWYFNDAVTDANYNTGVMGFYESGGFGYFFHFFPLP